MPHFEDSRYLAKEFSASNLKPIEAAEKTICFVDGGSAIIVKAPNFALAAHRVYYSKYRGSEREAPQMQNTFDFFSLTVSKPGNRGLNYETTVYYDDENARLVIPDGSDLIFDSFDKTMTSGPVRADIAAVAMIAREFAEWKMAGLIAGRENTDVIVRDGSLQTIKTNESKYAQAAANACADKNVILCGLSKTSTLLTSTGMPLLSAIVSLANENGMAERSWYYENIADISHPDHNAEMFVAKLHPASGYAFRIEVSKINFDKNRADDVIRGLAANATDLSFPGYPYGLINSDIMGRIPNDETKYNRTKALAVASARGIGLVNLDTKAADAHGVLDSM